MISRQVLYSLQRFLFGRLYWCCESVDWTCPGCSALLTSVILSCVADSSPGSWSPRPTAAAPVLLSYLPILNNKSVIKLSGGQRHFTYATSRCQIKFQQVRQQDAYPPYWGSKTTSNIVSTTSNNVSLFIGNIFDADCMPLSTRLEGSRLENDISGRPPILTSASCDLDLWPRDLEVDQSCRCRGGRFMRIRYVTNVTPHRQMKSQKCVILTNIVTASPALTQSWQWVKWVNRSRWVTRIMGQYLWPIDPRVNL